jgi:hypothetical protein
MIGGTECKKANIPCGRGREWCDKKFEFIYIA